jgi:hypothetical protein
MIYILFTSEGWFYAELECDLDAINMAELNPDVIRIESMGRIIIWEKPE